jgi:hypothetical protein
MFKKLKKLRKDNRGVFGLTAVQGFFAIILSIALLAFIIIVIMGTLSSSSILPAGTAQNQANSVLANVSGGVASFFSAINPVYAILAVLVIILVLVVLVRVVQAPSGSGTPQL